VTDTAMLARVSTGTGARLSNAPDGVAAKWSASPATSPRIWAIRPSPDGVTRTVKSWPSIGCSGLQLRIGADWAEAIAGERTARAIHAGTCDLIMGSQ
jgi:hypothetical protein